MNQELLQPSSLFTSPLEINGSCHCKKVQYSAVIPDKSNILDVTTYKCNCSICSKYRFWEIIIDQSNLKITKGKEDGSLREYKFEPFTHIHYFCNECGTHPFGLDKRNIPFYFINIPTINSITPEIMDKLKITYLDGLNDDFNNEPKIKNYL